MPDPDAPDWFALMRRGDFAAAWRLTDADVARRRGVPCWHLPRHEQYAWDGSPLTGERVLVRCYHGLGDTVQFIRYAPLLRAVAAEVIVWAQPALLPLVERVPGVDRAIPLHDGAPDVAYDADVEVMELPHVFRSTVETLPRGVAYLHADPAPLKRERGKLQVGIAWQPGDWDDRRAIPVRLLKPLARLPDVTLHCLQRGRALADWPADFGPVSGSDDVTAAARAMAALDLVITADSFPAHLAGALGRPVWTLLHSDPDWRWMLGRDDSPWYPTMRLFRQERAGNWEPVIARMAAELQRMAAARGAEAAV